MVKRVGSPLLSLFLGLVGFVIGLVLPGSSFAQQGRPPRPKPVVSPIIGENGAVTFQIKAPEAKQVAISGQMIDGKEALTRGDEGLWSVTLDSVSPGIYEYSFLVDGVKMVDPGNPSLKPQRSPNTSILHLSADAIHDFREVPHGTVHLHAHESAPIGRFREFQVYTPPGYEKGTESYPLLVLQHGHSDSFATWVAHGKAHWILDNLIAEGRAVPMIVVMLDGHPIPESYGDGRSPTNTEELRRDLLEATLPMVERLYRVKPGRENRAIAGLSMGGLHALTIGLNGLETFSWIGSFSAAVPEGAIAPALADAGATNEKLKLLWIACGKEDFLLEENEKLTALLKEKSIRHEWHLTEGDHSWPVWRGYLADFAPRLFR
jgi:enterochelin esterase family protein